MPTIVSKDEHNISLAIDDTNPNTVELEITRWTNFEEIDLYPEQAQQVVDILSNWLLQRAASVEYGEPQLIRGDFIPTPEQLNTYKVAFESGQKEGKKRALLCNAYSYNTLAYHFWWLGFNYRTAFFEQVRFDLDSPVFHSLKIVKDK